MEPKFAISEVFQTSWKCTKAQIWVLVGLYIGFTILSLIIGLFAMPAQSSITGQIIVNIITIIISAVFMLGYVKNIFQALDGEEPQFSAYGQQSRKILTFLIANILYGLTVLIGLVLLIVPGVYLALRLQYYATFIIEEDAGIIDSLKRSWAITQGHTMQLFLLWLTMVGIGLIGCILFFIGIFVAVPVIYMMYCYSFRKLNAVTISTPEEI